MVLVFVWRCQQASPGRGVGAPVDASLTPMIAVTNVGTGAIMPTTVIASAREAGEAGEVSHGECVNCMLLSFYYCGN